MTRIGVSRDDCQSEAIHTKTNGVAKTFDRMENTVPEWVVSEFAQRGTQNAQQAIQDSVKRYVRGDWGSDGEHEEYSPVEDNMMARSAKPESFGIEGTASTVGDVLSTMDNIESMLVSIDHKLGNERLTSDDVTEMNASQLEEILGTSVVNKLETELRKLPEQTCFQFANSTDSLGGRGNSPDIGPSGDAMFIIYKDIKNN